MEVPGGGVAWDTGGWATYYGGAGNYSATGAAGMKGFPSKAS